MLFVAGMIGVLAAVAGLLAVWLEDGEALRGGDRVAVIRLDGVIVDAREAVKALERYGKDPKVKAVVLRVETPGGAVGPTQEIFQAVRRWNEHKKIVASLGSMATSGGYYVACAAERIVASAGTVTGSIGVVVHMANLEKLLGKVGIQGDVIKSGEHKDMGSPHRALTPAERELIQRVIDDVHDQFVEDVAEGRHLPKDVVRSLADGRIFSGRQARNLGLVDDLGGLWDAVRLAAQLGGIPGEPRVVEEAKERFSLLDLLLGEGAVKLLPGALPQTFFLGYVFHP